MSMSTTNGTICLSKHLLKPREKTSALLKKLFADISGAPFSI